DVPVALCERNERVGRHEAEAWMLPAYERFCRTQPSVAQVQLRLQEQLQLPRVDRPAQVADDRELVAMPLVAPLVIEIDAVAGRACVVTRDGGTAQQLLGQRDRQST